MIQVNKVSIKDKIISEITNIEEVKAKIIESHLKIIEILMMINNLD
jgi:hypothetical protein